MGIFSKIKEAVLGKTEEVKSGRTQPDSNWTKRGEKAPPPARPVSNVDVESRLSAMDGADKLNWRTSIVDLLKLLGIDSSYANRKELATELGRADYEGSADDNIWLHKRTMRELADNGGKVPADMLD